MLKFIFKKKCLFSNKTTSKWIVANVNDEKCLVLACCITFLHKQSFNRPKSFYRIFTEL